MKARFILAGILICLAGLQSALAQNAAIVAPISACLTQELHVQNASTGATQFLWDFCQDALTHPPAHDDVTTVGVTNIPVGMEVAYDQGQWFGFVGSRDGGKQLTRLDFGNALTNTPTAVDLSGAVAGLGGTSDMKVIRDGGNWFGFVIDYQTNSLTRLDFGSSLGNAPTTTAFGNLGGPSWNGLYGITIAKKGTDFYGLVTCAFSGTISVLQFGASITNTPIVSHLTHALIVNPVKIQFVNQNGNWYALGTCLNPANVSNSSVILLDFGTDLTANPAISTSTVLPGASSLSVVSDGGAWFGLVFGNNGTLSRLDFGTSVTNTPVLTDLGPVGNTNVVYGFSMVKDWPAWKGLYIEVFSEKVHRMTFTDQCSGVAPLSSSSTNTMVEYTAPGARRIELAAFSAGGNMDTTSHFLQVQNLPAPVVSINALNECLGVATQFSESLLSGPSIASSHWDFGDGNFDTQANSSHTYATTGSYPVVLDVTGSNSCSNSTTRTVAIFNIPAADFTLPTNNPICTNQQLTFSNATTSDPLSSPTWQWFVNAAPVATTRDLLFAFTTSSAQNVKLRSSLQGCFNEKTQTISSLLAGPQIDFTSANGCETDVQTFTNLTTDPVTGFLWNFGDGNTSTSTNATHVFTSHGVFTVALTGNSANGCQNTSSKSISIYSKPHPDFTIDLPPFSCSGSPSQFNDATPNPTDSNISSWAWIFGDAANGTSSQRNPLYTYSVAGPYTVQLTATTNFGCSAAVQKPITISQSPIASFTHAPACAGQGTQFTDTSAGAIKSWLWKIDNSTYTFSDPINVFGASGIYSAKLTVTENNNCVAQATQIISVPVPQVPDFTVEHPCSLQPTKFKDITPMSADPLTSYDWNFGDLGTGSGSTAEFTFPATGNYMVKLDVHAQSGCVYSVSKTVSVVSPPVASFTTPLEVGAVPLTIPFTNTSSNAANFIWHFNDAANTTSIEVSPTFTFTSLGDYIVDLEAFNSQGCTDTFSKVISGVTPSADVAITELQIVPMQSTGTSQVLFTISNEGTIPIVNPEISIEAGGLTVLRQTLSLTVLPGHHVSQVLGFSFVTANLDYVCVLAQVPQDIASFNDKQCATWTDGVVTLPPYPSPASSEITMDWIAAHPGTVQLTIITSSGGKAFSQTLDIAAGFNQIRIDVSGFSAGIYQLIFEGGQGKQTYRFAVQ